MNCVEVQDRLWEESEAEVKHVSACACCLQALEEIRAIRAALRPGVVSTAGITAGVLAKMSRPRRRIWPSLVRYAAGIVIGVFAVLLLQPEPPPSAPQETKVVVREKKVGTPYPNLNRLLVRFGEDPRLEQEMIRILNEALRRRANATQPSSPIAKTSEVLP